MHKIFYFIYSRKLSLILFPVFFLLNIFYFTFNFLNTFLNPDGNGDEYYRYNLYDLSNSTLEQILYTPSQPFIFLSSIVDHFINNPLYSTRVVSLIACLTIILYFSKRIISSNSDRLEKVYKLTLFICAVIITNQIFIGTPDFLSVAFTVPAFLIILENVKFKKIDLRLKQSIFVGLFFGLSIVTRPTTLVLIFAFYLTLLLFLGLKPLLYKRNIIIAITCIFIMSLVNFLPIIEQQKIILDIKEIPEETGVNWFERNYLMAKYWDSNTIPNTQWVSTQEVIDFKYENPNFDFPDNQIDILLKEPGLYLRQMIRMFTKAMYSNYRYMYVLFPLLFLAFLSHRKSDKLNVINKSSNKLFQNRFIIVFHLLSIIFFSFLAVKLFEFRWVITTMILYCFFALSYLSHFPLKLRYLVYNISFLSGIGMYILFYVRYF